MSPIAVGEESLTLGQRQGGDPVYNKIIIKTHMVTFHEDDILLIFFLFR
jgi:hypothetical protein